MKRKSTDKMRKRYLAALAISALAAGCLTGPARSWAADTSWIGGEGDWDIGANWDNGVPLEGDQAFLTQGPYTVTYANAANPTLGLLSIDYDMSLSQSRDTLTTNNLNIGDNGVGMYGLGSGSLVVNSNMTIGWGGAGIFAQTGGEVSVSGGYGALTLGNVEGSMGIYSLNEGTLTLVAFEEYIGNYGQGYFYQYGGIHELNGAMYLGAGTGYGRYEMYGGELRGGDNSDDGIALGEWGGTGEFLQNGGAVEVDALFLARQEGSSGYYELQDGSLTIQREQIGNNSTGQFLQFGGVHTVGENLIIGVEEAGTGFYSLYDGELVTAYEVIGDNGTGSFDQFGGAHTVNGDLILGGQATGEGSYYLDTGTLEVHGNEYVGLAGHGVFDQYGQNTGHTVHGSLYVDAGVASKGEFYLRGGSLTVDGYTIVGNTADASGEFRQEDGSQVVSGGYQIWEAPWDPSWRQHAGLVIGRNGGSGRYDMTGGTLDVVHATIVGADGTGTFNLGNDPSRLARHTTGDLYVGYDTGNTGSHLGEYNLYDNGELRVVGGNGLMGFTVIGGKDYGPVGTGVFNQYGGLHATGGLFLGDTAGSSGTYNLYGGDLEVGAWEAIGGAGTGIFNQEGGMHTTNGDLAINNTGEYRMSGGALEVGGNIVNNGVFQHDDGILTFGAFSGSGTFIGDMINDSIVAPGNSPGILTINGNYTQTGLGTLEIELAGYDAGEFDVLRITGGSAFLSGALAVYLRDGFDPVIGSVFPFLSAENGISGGFDIYDLPVFNGKRFVLDFSDPYLVSLEVAKVPLPPSLLLLGSSLTGLLLMRRRKKSAMA
jgi:hypothetical protein